MESVEICKAQRFVSNVARAATALCALVCLGPASAQNSARVTTWNLEWFPNGSPKEGTPEQQAARMHAAAEVLRPLNSDILLLQEVRDYAVCAKLADAIKPGAYQVAICSAFKEANGLGKQQVAIVAKNFAMAAWAEPWKSMQGVDPPRGFAFAWFRIGRSDVAVYCLHLKSNRIARGDRNTETAKNMRKREVASQQLLSHMQDVVATAMPTVRSVIIGGDFNTNTDAFASESTLAKLTADGFHSCMEGLPLTQRVTCPSIGRYPDATFDYLLAKNGLLGRPEITPANVSDHYPVTCDITLAAALPTVPNTEIIIKVSTTIQIPYGTIRIPAGTRVEMKARQEDSLIVEYLDGVYKVPIANTDFQR